MRLVVEVLDLDNACPTPFPQIVEGNTGILEQTEIDSRDPQTFGVPSHSGRRIGVKIQRLQQLTKSRFVVVAEQRVIRTISFPSLPKLEETPLSQTQLVPEHRLAFVIIKDGSDFEVEKTVPVVGPRLNGREVVAFAD